MIFTNEIKGLVRQYLANCYSIHDDALLLDKQPWHKVVGLWWEAKAYYKKDDFCKSLDDLKPVEGMLAYVLVEPGKLDRYEYDKGEWVYLGDLVEGILSPDRKAALTCSKYSNRSRTVVFYADITKRM